jgi:hypothetical protein
MDTIQGGMIKSECFLVFASSGGFISDVLPRRNVDDLLGDHDDNTCLSSSIPLVFASSGGFISAFLSRRNVDDLLGDHDNNTCVSSSIPRATSQLV